MDFSTLFSELTGRESLFILIVMLAAFLLGLLTGYLLRSRRVIALKRELKDKKKELSGAKAELEALREQLALKDADQKKLGFSLQEAEVKSKRLEEEKEQLNKDVFMLRRQLEEGGSSDEAMAQVVKELNAEIERLKARSPEGAAESQALLLRRMDELSAQNKTLLKAIREQHRLGSAAPAVGERDFPAVHPMPGLPDAPLVDQEPELGLATEKPVGDKILPLEEKPERDDLTRIEGVGRFLEQQLNGAGIYTYEEISTWDSARVQEVTQAIGYFEGRIEKDRWVEQAAQLALQKQESPDDFLPRPQPLSTDETELTLFSGLTPQAEAALQSAGIRTWADLAASSVSTLENILKASGPELSSLNPEQWPQEAALAVKGEWAVLKGQQQQA